MQSQNLSVYIEGGTLFPVHRLKGNIEEYTKGLLETINLNKKDNKTYLDITELVGNNIMLTFKASLTYEYFSKMEFDQEFYVILSDLTLLALFRFDGIQYDPDDPYFDKRNDFLNIYIRHSHPYDGENAITDHISNFCDGLLINDDHLTQEEVNLRFPYEIGYMMDLNNRKIVGTTNNMIYKYAETYFEKINKMGEKFVENNIKYLTPDDIDDKLRGCKSTNKTECKGYFMNVIILIS